MATMQLALPQPFPDPLAKLALFFSPSKMSAASLPSSTVDSMNGIAISMGAIVRHTVSCSTAEGFRQRFNESLPKYTKWVVAMATVARVELDNDSYALLACESLTRLGKQLENHGIREFGTEASDQLSFFVFTMRRIVTMLPRMAASSAFSLHESENREEFIRFVSSLLISQFSFDCLREVVLNRIDAKPEVTSAIVEHMNLCSTAYASLRQLAERNTESVLALEQHAEWDDEDQALLDESEHSGTPIA